MPFPDSNEAPSKPAQQRPADRDVSGVSAGDSALGWLAIGTAVLLLGTALLVPVAPRNLDEAVYILMAEAASNGRLSIDNGYELYPAEELRFPFVRIGPLGLVPQYPSGYGFFALPFYLLAGPRGLVLLNMLAHLLAIGLTYGLAGQFGASKRASIGAALIFAFASFSIPYSYGIWPHSVAVAFVTASLLSIVAASQTAGVRKASLLAIVGGLLVGVGVNVRVDTILLVPPVLLWLVAQRHHWAKAALFSLGLVPGLLLASWLNYLKFSSFLPIDYGAGGTGNAAIAGYWPLLPVALVATIAAFSFSNLRIRAVYTARNIAPIAAASLAVLLLLEPLRELFFQTITGFYVLVIDFQAYEPPGGESLIINRGASGHLLAVGQLKRALVQSLPWLGVLPLTILFWRKRNALLMLLALVTVCWVAPFALRNWHGGGAPNMRYFLPILPSLAALAAICISRLVREAGIRRASGERLIVWTVAFTCVATIVVTLGLATQNSLALSIAAWGALLMAAAMAVTTLAIVAAQGSEVRWKAKLGLVLVTAGLIWSGGSALLYDLVTDRIIRSINSASIEAAESIDDGALIITSAIFQFMPQLERGDSYVAVPNTTLNTVERELIDYHLSAGRRVYVDGLASQNVLPTLGSPAYETREVDFANRVLVELLPQSRPE